MESTQPAETKCRELVTAVLKQEGSGILWDWKIFPWTVIVPAHGIFPPKDFSSQNPVFFKHNSEIPGVNFFK